jgi:peptidoglycan/xylan/chitin deacetylase (PgdA/CDA1 family)
LLLIAVIVGGDLAWSSRPAARDSRFSWPDGKKAAISLTFDDARPSQLTAGVALFAQYNTPVTFYLTASNIAEHGPAWRQAAGAGHELANHSTSHPCSGNFAWSRKNALEDYTIDRLRLDLLEANRVIEAATGIRPTTFAYPCGQTYVGRGANVSSYVPLINELFLAGRGWQGETANDPEFVDLAQLLGYPMDDVDFEELAPAIEMAIGGGRWLVLAGHDIGTTPGPQVTRVSMLRQLLADLRRPERGVWIATVAQVAAHLKKHRS